MLCRPRTRLGWFSRCASAYRITYLKTTTDLISVKNQSRKNVLRMKSLKNLYPNVRGRGHIFAGQIIKYGPDLRRQFIACLWKDRSDERKLLKLVVFLHPTWQDVWGMEGNNSDKYKIMFPSVTSRVDQQ